MPCSPSPSPSHFLLSSLSPLSDRIPLFQNAAPLRHLAPKSHPQRPNSAFRLCGCPSLISAWKGSPVASEPRGQTTMRTGVTWGAGGQGQRGHSGFHCQAAWPGPGRPGVPGRAVSPVGSRLPSLQREEDRRSAHLLAGAHRREVSGSLCTVGADA